MLTYKQRLMANVVKQDGHWLYNKGREKTGYCRIMVNRNRIGVHRLSWIVFRGPIESGLEILHHCDIPNCVRPSHLFKGTQHDNILDCLKKGRLASAKLNPSKVRKIRRMLVDGVGLRAIARIFNVTHRTIGDIKWKQRWNHVL
jgi:hypothetical protein